MFWQEQNGVAELNQESKRGAVGALKGRAREGRARTLERSRRPRPAGDVAVSGGPYVSAKSAPRLAPHSCAASLPPVGLDRAAPRAERVEQSALLIHVLIRCGLSSVGAMRVAQRR